MKRFVLFLFGFFVSAVCSAETISLTWDVDGTAYTQNAPSTCTIGGDLNIPTTNPTKRGYTFVGWEIPKYFLLEYIENTPSETYLNTGFYPNGNTKLVTNFVNVYYVNNGDSGACEFIRTSSNNFGVDSTYHSRYPKDPRFFFGSFSNTIQGSNQVNHTYTLSQNGLYMDDVKKRDINSGMFISDTPLFIFGKNANTVTPCVIRLYSLQLYQNDVLVHDYVPAMKPDGTVCLYDKVTDSFLYNLGTGSLVAGPTIDYE